MLQKMALNVFELSNYVVTSEFNQIVVNTLSPVSYTHLI